MFYLISYFNFHLTQHFIFNTATLISFLLAPHLPCHEIIPTSIQSYCNIFIKNRPSKTPHSLPVSTQIFLLFIAKQSSVFSLFFALYCFLLYLSLFQCTLKFLLMSMNTLSITENTVCNRLIAFEYSIIFNRLLLGNICYSLNIIENFLLWGS